MNLEKKNNLKFIHGIDMLIYQAIRSFEIWTGIKSDFNEIKEKVLKIK